MHRAVVQRQPAAIAYLNGGVEGIRSAVVDLLNSRIQVLGSLYIDEFEKYSNNLAKGKHEPFRLMT
jgi:hypothetical protein